MILVILTAVLAVSGAAKLDQGYLPPITAKTAGGSPGSILPPTDGLPTGSYTNDAQGVVVDAAAAGTRAASVETTGLGGPRASYGSTDSKVGNAAFEDSGFNVNTRIAPGFSIGQDNSGANVRIAPGFNSVIAEGDADKTKASTLKFANEIGLENYSYGFETDNGISVGANGVAGDGIKANGGYSYKGDDGKVYSVSYTADEGGYKPHGSHLPTPPPIPAEILESLEKNAKEEAAGHVDDGTYDAQKYNDEGNNGNHGASGHGTVTVQSIKTFGSNAGSHGQAEHGKPQFGAQTAQDSAQGATFTQTRFGAHSQKTGSGSYAFASSDDNKGVSPTGATYSGFRAPGSQGNSAYSSAVTSGAGSASAFATAGSAGSGLKNQYHSSKYGSGQTHQGSQIGTTHFSEANPTPTFASASAQGQDTLAQAVSTASPSFEGSTPAQGTFDSNTYSQSSQSNGLVNIVESTGPKQPGFGQFNYNSNTYNTGSSGQSGQVSQGVAGFPNRFGQTQSTFGKPINTGSYTGSTFGSASKPQSHLSSKPGQYTQTGNTFTSTSQTQSFNTGAQPASGFLSAGSPTKVPDTELSTPFETESGDLGLSGNTALPSPTPSQPSFSSQQTLGSFQSQTNQYQSTSNNAFAQTGSTTPKPALGQGVDSSYYYNQPAKPFVTGPHKLQTGQFGSSTTGSSQYGNRQPNTPVSTVGTSFPNKPIVSSVGPTASSQSGQYQGSTGAGYNGITQATITPFPSAVPTSVPSRFGEQSSQSGSTQFGQSSSSQFSSTGSQYQKPTQFGQKPIVQSQTEDSEEGTIYQYNKPSQTLSQTNTQAKPSQTTFGSQTNKFGNQQSNKPFGTTSFQQTQTQGSTFGSQSTSQTTQGATAQSQFGQNQFGQNQFGSKPFGSQYQQTQFGSQYNKKPTQTTEQISQNQGTIYEYNKPTETPSQTNTQSQTSVGQTTFGQSHFGSQHSKPVGSQVSSVQQTQTSTFGSQSTNQFGQNQFGKKPVVGSQYQQTQFGSQFNKKPEQSSFTSQTDQSSVSQNQGTIYEYNKPTESSQTDSQTNVGQTFGSHTQFGSQQSKPVGSQGSFQQTQTSTFGSQSTNQFGQNQFDKKPFGGSQYQQTQFGSQFNKKPEVTSQISSSSVAQNQGTVYEYNKPTETSTQTDSQTNVGQTSFVSQTQPTKPFSSQVSSFQQTQSSTFGSQSTNQGSGLTGQYQFGKKPFGSSQYQHTQFNKKPDQTGFQQTFASTSSQLEQSGQTNEAPVSQGTLYEYNKPDYVQTETSSSVQSGQGSTTQDKNPQSASKPFGSSLTGSTFQQTTAQPSTFGSQSVNQFGKKPGYTGFQNQQFGQKVTGSTFQQTQTSTSSGSQTGSQFSQKFPTSQGTDSSAQNTFGSTTGSQFGQSVGSVVSSTPQPTSQYGNKPFGSQFTQGSVQTTQFGSQLAQKPQSTQGSTLTSSSVSTQNTQTQSGTTFPSRFGEKPSVGSNYNQYGQKPFGSSQTGTFQQTQFGSTSGQKPFESTSTVESTDSQAQTVGTSSFTQAQQTVQGSTVTDSGSQTQSSFGQKPTGFGIFGQKPQTNYFSSTPSKGQSQFGQQTFGSTQTGQYNQFGQKPQTTQTSLTFGQKPGSYSQQTVFGSSTGSQVGQTFGSSASKGQTVVTNQYGLKPQTQFGSSTSQLGQQTQTGATQTGFGFQQSQFGQKPQTVQSTSFTSTGSKGQSVSQFGQKPFGSSTGSSFSQTQYGSQFGQKPTSSVGQVQSISQYGNKPFGSQSQYGQAVNQQSQSGSTQFGQTNSQNSFETTQVGQQPIDSTGTTATVSETQTGVSESFGQKPQTGFGSGVPLSASQNVQQGQKPFGISQTGSTFQQTQSGTSFPSRFGEKPSQESSQTTGTFSQTSSQTGTAFQQNQFGTTQFGSKPQVVSQVQPISQYGKKPFGSTQSQFGSQFTQNTGIKGQSGQTQFGQKPFGSSQSTGFGNYQSQFEQKPQAVSGTQTQTTFGQSQFGSQENKPFGNTQTPFQSQFGTAGQKQQSFASAFASSGSTDSQNGQVSKYQNTQFGSAGTPQKPFGSSFTQQYTQSSSQFGSKPFGSQSTFQTGQVTDQNTQQTSANAAVDSFSSQSSSQTIGTNGYNYQKPQGTFAVPSRFSEKPEDQKTQPQTTFSQVSSPQPSVELPGPFSTASSFALEQGSTVGSTQFGAQPTKPTNFNTGSLISQYGSQGGVSTVAPNSQFTGKPSQFNGQSVSYHTTPATQISFEQLQLGIHSTPAPIIASHTTGPFVGQPIQPSTSAFGLSTSAPVAVSSTQDSFNQESSYSTVQTPLSVSQAESFVSEGFGGPRDPPRFDDKTGYHY